MIFGENRLVIFWGGLLSGVMSPILQRHIPYDVTQPQRLPGMMPLDPNDWLWVDEVYGAQMALRRDLIAHQRDQVVALDPSGQAAAQELVDHALAWARQHLDIVQRDHVVTCPDGLQVQVDPDDPMGTLGRIFQNDFCILEKRGAEHVMTGAVLCFPASWRLGEKFMRPLTGIHDTVAPYDAGVAKRVQRLFDAIRVDGPLWRFNALYYRDPALHQPNGQHSVRDAAQVAQVGYVRSERQSLLRLPQSEAVVFGIHTIVVDRSRVGALPVSQP